MKKREAFAGQIHTWPDEEVKDLVLTAAKESRYWQNRNGATFGERKAFEYAFRTGFAEAELTDKMRLSKAFDHRDECLENLKMSAQGTTCGESEARVEGFMEGWEMRDKEREMRKVFKQ